MPRILVPPAALDAERVSIRGAELRHLRDVLRLGVGDAVELFDGAGRGRAAVVERVARSEAVLRALEPLDADRESPLAVTLAVAITKGAKLDWVVEKATELGVGAILPFASARSVPDPGEFGRRRERLERIAAAAAAQCGRSRCPVVGGLGAWTDVTAAVARHECAIVFHPAGGVPLIPEPRPSSALIVVGAEGGLTETEVASARAAGAVSATLGPRVLRAETAAIAASALVQHLWGDLTRPVS